MRRTLFPVLLAATAGAILVENLFYFPLSVPYMKQLAGGMPLLDMRLGYTPGDVNHLFAALGQAGRDAYLRLLWTIDVVLPALFGLFLSSAMRRGTFRAWRWIPFAAAVCDYTENFSITILLLRYPLHGPGLPKLASILTMTKLVLYASGLMLAIGGFLGRIFTAAPSAEG